MPSKGLVLNFGAYRGSDDVDTPADLFISNRELPVVEPYWMERSADRVVYGGPTFEFVIREDAYEWRDGSGRVQITAERLGQACAVWAPPQPGIENGFLDRSHLCWATGTIDGERVEGLFAEDHVYSAPGLTLRESGLVKTLENFWMQWLIEFEDGSIESGTAWRGQPGTGFAHAHHYADGRSRARRDGRIEIIRNGNGSIERALLTFPEVSFEFEQVGSYDWPFHTYGRVASCSREAQVVKSWHYIENWPLNMHLIEEYQHAYQQLYGRPCSLRKLTEGARMENEALVLVPADQVAPAIAGS
jgi:hypothetical protein